MNITKIVGLSIIAVLTFSTYTYAQTLKNRD